MTNLSYIVVGVLTGICSGFFGVGGGIVLVPILIFFFGYGQALASGTSLVSMLLPVGALGVWQYYKAGKIDTAQIQLGLLIATGIFLGTYLGAKVAVNLNETLLRKGFALLMVIAAAKLWFSSK